MNCLPFFKMILHVFVSVDVFVVNLLPLYDKYVFDFCISFLLKLGFVEAIDSDEKRVSFLNPKFENGEKDKIEVLITLNAFYEGYEHKGDLFAIEKLIGEDY